MKKRIAFCLPLLAFIASCPAVWAQGRTQSQKPQGQAAQSTASDAQKKNIQAYIDLMRANVRQEKAQILGAVMQLDAEDAAKSNR